MSWTTTSGWCAPRQECCNTREAFYKPELQVEDPRKVLDGERLVVREEIVRECEGKFVMEMIEAADKSAFRIILTQDMARDMEGMQLVKGPIISQWHAYDDKEEE